MNILSLSEFPIVLCDGFCGVGINDSSDCSHPSFFMKSFEGDETIHFQPKEYFPFNPTRASFSLPSCTSSHTTPSKQEFSELIEKFKSSKSLKKIVLARKRTFKFKENLSSLEILSTLCANFPKENVFAYIKNEHEIFFGSTPENLYTREKGKATVDCIGGTVAGEDLSKLFSEKMKTEHGYIVDFVVDQVKQIGDDLALSPLHTKKAAHLTHLYQTVSASLLPGIDDFAIIDKLHPTPATLGTPASEASLFLQKIWKRNFYAGCIGWIGKDQAIVKVALRCGKAKNNSLTLFAGAGITDESDCEEETREIDNKFRTLEGVFLENAMSN